MNPLRAFRRWPLGIRLAVLAALMAAVWVPMLLVVFRGPWGTAVRDARPWSWPVSTPEAEGLDPEAIDELVKVAREGERYPYLHALLVARHGRLVTEEYFNGWKADHLHTLQSVSKSFTSALVGIALERGEFRGLDEPVLDFFPNPEEFVAIDPRKASLRLRDLLTMRTGVDYDEEGVFSPHAMLNLLPWGRDRWYLRRTMLDAPGTTFRYDSGGVVLLSAMLKRRAGLHAEAYAERHLFAPLGIARESWRANLTGHTHTGGGLSLTARDTAKLGQLYLQGGRWEGIQVVPEAWVRESLHPHVDFGKEGRGVVGYGYLWWVLSDGAYAAIGRWGQYLIVVPERELVVVVFRRPFARSAGQGPLEMFYDGILPAVRRP